jgi:hypothetical protein
MSAATLRNLVSRRFEGEGGTLKGRVIGDGEAPIAIEARPGAGRQIPVNHCEQAGDVLFRGLVRAEPPVFLPVLKAHVHFRSGTASIQPLAH